MAQGAWLWAACMTEAALLDDEPFREAIIAAKGLALMMEKLARLGRERRRKSKGQRRHIRRVKAGR